MKNTIGKGPGPLATVCPERFSHLIAGLSLLLRALDYAADVGGEAWDFAIEISDLRETGMTTSDFRWLVGKGFVEHGEETSSYGAPHRCFRRGEGLTFLPTSALVLTSLGAAEVRKLLVAELPSPACCTQQDGRGAGGESSLDIHLPSLPNDEESAAARLLRLPPCPFLVPASVIHIPPAPRPIPTDLKPVWEARSRELRVGEWLVKRFRVPAGNQELVLSAFEEEGWPAYIDDPLPMKAEIVPKQRLRNVIARLNGRQLVRLLRFHGNGNGEGVGWQLLPVPPFINATVPSALPT